MVKRKTAILLMIVLFAAGVAVGALFIRFPGDPTPQPAVTERQLVNVAVNAAAENTAAATEGAQSETEPQPLLPTVAVTPAKTKTLQTNTFNNGLFSIQIPDGWTLSAVSDTQHVRTAVFVYDPSDPDYMICFCLQLDGFLKTREMREWYASYYPDTVMAVLPYLDPATTENFFSNWNAFLEAQPEGVFPWAAPSVNGYRVIESLGETPLGGEAVHACFTNAKGETVDGVFTCAFGETDLYYVTALTVQNAVFFTAPHNHLPQWAGILSDCLASLTFSDAFVRALTNDDPQLASAVRADEPIYGEAVSAIMRGWNARRSDYDTVSQKQNDADLGMIRIYDVVSGELLLAPENFPVSDWNGRYLPAEDGMYNQPVDGYIQIGS